MRRAAALLFLGLIAFASPCRGFENLGLRPSWGDPAAPIDSLDMNTRLARIERLERAVELGPPATDLDLLELVRLYRSSPLMKHRVRALEWSSALPDSLRLPEQVLTFQRTFNPWDAGERMREWIDRFPDRARPLRWYGLYLLQEGLRHPELLEESLATMRAAAACADATDEDWRGVACALVALQRYGQLSEVAARLLRYDGPGPGPFLFAALAHESEGLSSRAAQEFRSALDRMSPVSRERFDFPHAFVVREDTSLLGSSLVEPPELPQQRGWWVRLIEAEALFSDPDAGLHSWDTGPGQVYLLFGRPTFMRTFWFPTVEEVTAVPELSRHADDVAYQMSRGSLGSGTELWVWLVKLREDRTLPLVFHQFTRFAKWQPNSFAQTEIIEPLQKAGPIRLVASLPAPPREAAVQLHLLSTGFRTRPGEMRIEAWASVGADPPNSAAAVRLRLLREDGHEIDRVDRALDDSRARQRIRSLVPRYPRGARGWIHGFGALVPPGRYLATVEVLDADGSVLAARDQSLAFREDRVARTGLQLSELVLCDAYEEGISLRGLPDETVRFARVVIPNPEAALHAGQTSIAVYYEVYGAEIDASGRTHLEVEYEVYPRRGFDPYVGGAGYVDGELVRPVVRALFPDERTGRSVGGVIVKGTRLELDDAEPGDYVLLVRVGDRLTERESSRTVQFRVPASANVAPKNP